MGIEMEEELILTLLEEEDLLLTLIDSEVIKDVKAKDKDRDD